MLNILIPMAGKGTFEVSSTRSFPKVLTDINGKLLIERASKPFINLHHQKKIITALPESEIKDYKLDKILTLLDDSIQICPVNHQARGAVCSALLAIEYLDLDAPIILSSFEQVLDLDLNPFVDEFINSEVDAGILTFEGIHPKWSYVTLTNDNFVTQAAEKIPISRNAIAGFYYFRTAALFIESAKDMIRNDVTYNELFYISHALNEVILKDGKVLALPIDESKYFHIHDEHSLDSFEEQVTKITMKNNQTLHSQTQAYVDAFNQKNLDKVATFFADSFSLTDPAVSITGKNKVVAYISELFETNSDLRFESKSITVDSQRTVIEFELTLGESTFIGTDVINWNNDNKMVSMAAYLYEKK